VVGGHVCDCLRLLVCFSILWRRRFSKGVGGFNFFQGGRDPLPLSLRGNATLTYFYGTL
jgi:hypothetical protein